MSEAPHGYALALLIVSAVVLVGALIGHLFAMMRMPAMIDFIVLGVVIGAVLEAAFDGVERARSTIELLGRIGIITLLFRVGLESNIPDHELRPQFWRLGCAQAGL